MKVIFNKDGYKLWNEQYSLINDVKYRWLFRFMRADILSVLNRALDNIEELGESYQGSSKQQELREIIKEQIMALHPFYTIDINVNSIIGNNSDALAENLYTLLKVQRRLNSWAYILLDIDNTYFDDLSIRDRINIYGFLANSKYNMHGLCNDDRITSDSGLQEDLYFANLDHNVSRMIDKDNRELINTQQINKQMEVLERLEQSYCNEEYNNEIKKNKQLLLKYLDDIKSDNYLVREFTFPGFEYFIKYEFIRMLEEKAFIRKCRQCGTYFTLCDLKEFYCDNYNEEYKCSCKEIPANRRYRKRLEDLGIKKDWDWAENFTKNNKKSTKKHNHYYPNNNADKIINEIEACFEDVKYNKQRLLRYGAKEEDKISLELNAFRMNISKMRSLAEELKKKEKRSDNSEHKDQ